MNPSNTTHYNLIFRKVKDSVPKHDQRVLAVRKANRFLDIEYLIIDHMWGLLDKDGVTVINWVGYTPGETIPNARLVAHYNDGRMLDPDDLWVDYDDAKQMLGVEKE